MIVETSLKKRMIRLPQLQMLAVVPKVNQRFIISWLVSSAIMLCMYFFWHGSVLNDFLQLAYPKGLFYSTSAAIYLVIGFMITFLTYTLKRIKNSFKYGLVVGAVSGVLVYVFLLTSGILFDPISSLPMMILDLSWQVLEQATGGFFCGWIYRLLYMRKSAQPQLCHARTCNWFNRL